MKNYLAIEMQKISQNGNIEFVVHFAGYYTFDNTPHPEYERTNVNGTKLVLKYSKLLNPKRFIFSSSVAACDFPKRW